MGTNRKSFRTSLRPALPPAEKASGPFIPSVDAVRSLTHASCTASDSPGEITVGNNKDLPVHVIDLFRNSGTNSLTPFRIAVDIFLASRLDIPHFALSLETSSSCD